MLAEQGICRLPAWVRAFRLELAPYRGRDVRVGTVMKAFNQAQRCGWERSRANFYHVR
jgi:hypothetical protein